MSGISAVTATAPFVAGTPFQVTVTAKDAVFNVDGEYFAIDDTCTHQDASLADGWLDGCAIECPLHSSCFDLRTGRPSAPPAKVAVRTHQVVVSDGMVHVQIGAAVDGAA